LVRASGYRPSELDEAIKEELEKLGGYDAWRRKTLTYEVSSEPPKRRTPTKSEQYADACKLAPPHCDTAFPQPSQFSPNASVTSGVRSWSSIQAEIRNRTVPENVVGCAGNFRHEVNAKGIAMNGKRKSGQFLCILEADANAY